MSILVGKGSSGQGDTWFFAESYSLAENALRVSVQSKTDRRLLRLWNCPNVRGGQRMNSYEYDRYKKTILLLLIIVAIGIGIWLAFPYLKEKFGAESNSESKDNKQTSQETTEFSEESYKGTVFFTSIGKKYHLYQDCSHLNNSDQIYSGDISVAQEAGCNGVCTTCKMRYNKE